MRHSTRRSIVLAAAVCLNLSIALAVAGPTTADRVYHSQHITLMPVGDAPLAKGLVENTHTNGPRVFAHERYVLVGASPRTEYAVTIHIHGDPGATTWLGAMPTVASSTNGVGNGVGRFALPLSGVPEAFHGLTIYLVWELATGGAVAYETPVSDVVLD